MRKKGSAQRTWTTMEIMYVARFYDYDGYKKIAYALDRKPAMVVSMYMKLERDLQVDYLKRKWNEIHGWR